jgi:ribosomal protein L21E
MPGGQGLRARTRHMFQRGFRKHGFIPLSTYLRNYKLGDMVDIKVNGAIHKASVREGGGLAAGLSGAQPPRDVLPR